MSVELSVILETIVQPAVERQLARAGYDPDNCSFRVLRGDGSDRKFLRVRAENRSIIVILPGMSTVQGKAEARSGWLIGRHLQGKGVPVPEMISHDPETGAILCEDLGEKLLHLHITEDGHGDELLGLYKQAVDVLVHMQINGRLGFKADFCWDQPVYDRRTMLERESGYFFDSCCRKMMGIKSMPEGLESEFSTLADLAGEQPAEFFLHRDFQSRNVMVKDGRLRVIDFQGARFGPLAYDLASLLIDPYVQLSGSDRETLLEYYLDQASDRTSLNRDEFLEGYSWLAIQRNLQILGAFAFLSAEKSKPFFLEYLQPAAACLLEILDCPSGKRFPLLRTLVTDFKGHLNM